MSIKLRIIEKRLKTLEEALSFLGESLSMTFPNMGVHFDSVAAGIQESHKEIEQYKAQKVRAKRNDFFERNTVINYDDLGFLIRECVPQLAEDPKCDRVCRHPTAGLGSDVVYQIDLGNLCIESVERGISVGGIVSHELKLIARLGMGLEMSMRETITVDMETMTYDIPFDRTMVPLAKHRMIAWFYDQMQAIDDGVWYLPIPHRGNTNDRMTIHERRLHPGESAVQLLLPVAERLHKMAQAENRQMYGVSLRGLGNHDNHVFLHVYARLDDSGAPVMGLRVVRDRQAFHTGPEREVGVELLVSDPFNSDDYAVLCERLEAFPLAVVAKVHEALTELDNPDAEEPITELRLIDRNYAVEWLAGNKREETE